MPSYDSAVWLAVCKTFGESSSPTTKASRVDSVRVWRRAYYFLILFSSFLNESKAETWRQLRDTLSYESYVKDRPVFKTIERELDTAGIEALVPLEKPIAAGNALSDEVAEFVAKRSGRILSPFTLLKSDYFVRSLSFPLTLQLQVQMS